MKSCARNYLCSQGPAPLMHRNQSSLPLGAIKLECGHSFCTYCINILHKTHNQNKCPRCRKVTNGKDLLKMISTKNTGNIGAHIELINGFALAIVQQIVDPYLPPPNYKQTKPSSTKHKSTKQRPPRPCPVKPLPPKPRSSTPSPLSWLLEGKPGSRQRIHKPQPTKVALQTAKVTHRRTTVL